MGAHVQNWTLFCLKRLSVTIKLTSLKEGGGGIMDQHSHLKYLRIVDFALLLCQRLYSLAQWLEHWSCNLGGLGLIPSQGGVEYLQICIHL